MRVGFGTWRLLYTGIVLLGIGIAFIVMISGEMADYAKRGADYSTLQWSDFKEGMMIEGDLPVNYGSYEEIVNDDKNKSIGQFYLIDAGDDCFMGIYPPIDELINSLDDQYDAWSNGEDISPVHFKGKVTKMDSQDKGFIRDYLISAGYTRDEVDNYIVDLYIKCVDTESHPVMLIIGIAAAAGGAVFLLMFVRRKIMGR